MKTDASIPFPNSVYGGLVNEKASQASKIYLISSMWFNNLCDILNLWLYFFLSLQKSRNPKFPATATNNNKLAFLL